MLRPLHFLLSVSLILTVECCCEEEKEFKHLNGNQLDQTRLQQIRIPENVLRMLAQYDSLRSEQQPQLTRISRANGKPTFIRFGKRSKPTFIRFGKRSFDISGQDQWV